MSESIPMSLVRRRVLGLILGLFGGLLTFSSLVGGLYTGITGLWPRIPKDMLIDLVEACVVGIVLLYFGSRLWRRPLTPDSPVPAAPGPTGRQISAQG